MAVLPKGANAPLNATSVDAVLEWTESGGASHDVDLCVLLLRSNARVRDDSDFVFYNQPSHPSGAVRHEGRTGTTERIHVDIPELPDGIEKIVLVSSISDGSFGEVRGLAITLVDAGGGNDELRFDAMGATNETAFVVGELYKRAGDWKFRAVGQGWDSGLAGLATHYGVNIGPLAESGPEEDVQPVGEEAPIAPSAAFGTPEPPTARTAPSVAGSATSPGWPERPAEPGRRRLTYTRVPAMTPSLGGETITLGIGQPVLLLQQGATPETLWLRVSHTGTESAVRADLSVIAYDEWGVPRGLVYFGQCVGAGGAICLVNKPTSATADDTAAVELRLNAVEAALMGLVVAATSYEGKPLSPNGTFVTELAASDGMVFARTECPAPDAIGSLLVSLTRDSGGAWVLMPLAAPSPGRTGRSVIGAGYWALTA